MQNRIVSPYIRMALAFISTSPGVEKVMPERRLLDYHLFIIEKGGGSITLENKTIALKEGDICLIPPGVKHYFSLSRGVYPYVHFDLYYHPDRQKSFIVSGGKCDFTKEEQDLMQPFIFEKHADFPYRISLIKVDFYLDRIYRIIKLFAEMPVYCEEQMQTCILELLNPFLENVQNNKLHQVSTNIDVKLQKAIMYIRAHLYCKISLPQLSKVAALSSSHLSHLFKEQFEVGPIAYHRRCRLQAAADQLSKTSQSIQEVAYDFGFESALNFSRAFKEEFNTSPKFYRSER